MILLVSEFTILEGKVDGALKLVSRVKEEAEKGQPGTLVYLVHRKLDAHGKPGRHLVFYEEYADQAALDRHLASPSWKALVRQWDTYFEGTKPSFYALDRIAAFTRPGALPVVPADPTK